MQEHKEATTNHLNKQLEIFKQFIMIRAGIEQALAPIASRQGLTPIGVFILCLVSEQENPTISRVCREMNLNQGNASNMCKKLEQGGFIKRTRSTTDERLVRIELTDSGKAALNAISSEISKISERIYTQDPLLFQNSEESFKRIEKIIHILSEQSLL